MSQRGSIRELFAQLQKNEEAFRLDVVSKIEHLIRLQLQILEAANLAPVFPTKTSVDISDGPTRISAWDDQVDEVIIGCTLTHVIIDEGGNESAVKLDDLSTENLVDTFAALEAEIESGKVKLTDYTNLIK